MLDLHEFHHVNLSGGVRETEKERDMNSTSVSPATAYRECPPTSAKLSPLGLSPCLCLMVQTYRSLGNDTRV